MSSYVQVLYQIVFCTKYRHPVLLKSGRQLLYRYVWGICKARNCHLILRIHPSVAIADLVKEIKVGSSKYIRLTGIFPEFTNWQTGYAAFSYAPKALPNLVRYVKNQERHHGRESSQGELLRLLNEHEVTYDPRQVE